MAYAGAVVSELTRVDDAALNPLGTRRIDPNGNEFVYLQGVADVIAGSWVSYDEAFLATGLDTDEAASLVGPVAVAQAAVVANKFGWFQIFGSCQAGSGDVADNAKVYATGTVFICDDAAVVGAQVIGAVWRSADASNLATVQLSYPFVGFTDTDPE